MYFALSFDFYYLTNYFEKKMPSNFKYRGLLAPNAALKKVTELIACFHTIAEAQILLAYKYYYLSTCSPVPQLTFVLTFA